MGPARSAQRARTWSRTARAAGRATVAAAFALAVAAAAALPALAPAPAAAADGDRKRAYDLYRQIDGAIDRWHPEAGRELLDELVSVAPGEDPIQYLAAARLNFHLGAYEQAVQHLDTMRQVAGKLDAYVRTEELIRATHEQTKSMVSQRSEHFQVFTDPGTDKMLAPFVLETLEAALAAYQIDLGIEIPPDALPIRVEVYPQIKDFVAVSTLTPEEVKTSGTVALCKFNRLMIVSPRRLVRGYRWRDTLSHELVHYVLSRHTNNRLPLWLHEGIAKFEERRWRSPEIGKLHPIQQSILSEAREKDVYVHFNEMMPSLAKLESGWQTSLAFAEVTLLVSHLVQDGGMGRLREVIDAYAKGRETGHAALGIDSEEALWEQFEPRLKTTPLNPVPGYRFIPPSVTEDPAEAEHEPIAKQSAKRFTRLGDLLRKEGHWAAAVTEYAKAKNELGYQPGPLSLKRAEALMLGGLYSEAEAELQQLIRRDPDRATAHYLLGKIALFKDDPDTALARYETAFGVAPFTDEVMEGLVTAAERLDNEKKLTAYRQAREIWYEHRDR